MEAKSRKPVLDKRDGPRPINPAYKAQIEIEKNPLGSGN
jgi:hypothetical protein